ncbi:MAG TPA: hypothetical protein VHW23_41050 [Kofleriaceae bacterium]|nr:hypothetical protein [Kofleriaceae bacterium]
MQTGIDDNGDGALQDTEIDQTTRVCNPLDLMEGDFAESDWSDPVKVAALEGARVVTGSIAAGQHAAVLPRLELVTGDLVVSDGAQLPVLRRVGGALGAAVAVGRPPELPMLATVEGNAALSSGLAGLDLPALTSIGGDLTTAGLASLTLPALATVGGTLDVEEDPSVLAAPALATIGGSLVASDMLSSSLALPGVQHIGGDLRIAGGITAIALDHVTSVGGDLRLDVLVGGLDVVLPALQTLGGSIAVHPDLSAVTGIELPALTTFRGGITVEGASRLTQLALPSVTRIAGDISITQATALTTIDLSALVDVGRITILDAPDLTTLSAPALTTANSDGLGATIDLEFVGLDTLSLASLTTAPGGVRVVNAAALRSVQLPTLLTASTISVLECAAFESLAAPELARANFIDLLDSPLHALDLGALATAIVIDIQGGHLADLSGLRSLQSVRSLALGSVTGLVDLTGLAQLTDLGGLDLRNDLDLTSLDGLDQVRQITSTVSLVGNPALASLAGLRGVNRVGSLHLEGSPAVTDLALTGLVTIDGALQIIDMDGLTNLGGLDALTSVGGAIVFTGNDQLPQAAIDAFKARLGTATPP